MVNFFIKVFACQQSQFLCQNEHCSSLLVQISLHTSHLTTRVRHFERERKNRLITLKISRIQFKTRQGLDTDTVHSAVVGATTRSKQQFLLFSLINFQPERESSMFPLFDVSCSIFSFNIHKKYKMNLNVNFVLTAGSMRVFIFIFSFRL